MSSLAPNPKFEMNPAREAHLQAIKDYICGLIDTKYRAGQLEHGGDLWRKDVKGEIVPEFIDAFIYIATEELKERR